MLTVNYPKQDVLKTWLSLPIDKRRSLLTFNDPDLITLVNWINTSLVLTSNECAKGAFEVLESIDTFWTEPIHMKIKPGLLKGQKLINLLESKYQDFLIGVKVLHLDPSDLRKIFETSITTWDLFQLTVCKLIEQAFLTAHFSKLSDLARKAAFEIQKEEKNKEIKEKKIKVEGENEGFYEWFDPKCFLVDICSDISTDVDEKDLNELLFDLSCVGGKSFRLRKYYASVAAEWDEEVGNLIDREIYASQPFEDWAKLPIVAYYDYFQGLMK